MKALKVLYRSPNPPTIGGHDPHALYSAIPTPYALQYWPGKKTVPKVGRLMVYLSRDLEEAEQFCRTAGEWYRHGRHGIKPLGTIEVWSAECHNLYRLDYFIDPCDFGYEECGDPHLRRFWAMIGVGDDPHYDVRWAIRARKPIWTTDWIIPLERLRVYNIRHRQWIIDDYPIFGQLRIFD